MTRKRLDSVAILVIAVAFGAWGVDLLPGLVATGLVAVGAIWMLVDFARWLDRHAYD